MNKYNIEFAHVYGGDFSSGGVLNREQHISIERTSRVINVLKKSGLSYSLCILVDDYNEPINVQPDAIIKEFREFEIVPDFIVYESAMDKRAGRLLDALPHKFINHSSEGVGLLTETDDLYLWAETDIPAKSIKELVLDEVVGRSHQIQESVETISVRRFGAKSRFEIVLASQSASKKMYSCPLMTACWHLSRLGTDGYGLERDEVIFLKSDALSIHAERLITVLPRRYLKVEATALEILSLAKSKTISSKRRRMEYVFF